MSFLLAATMAMAVVVLLVASYLGYRYPAGRPDWPHDAVTTARYAISGALFLLVLGLIYWITRYWDYPVGGKALAYISFGTIAVLFVLALMRPRGQRA